MKARSLLALSLILLAATAVFAADTRKANVADLASRLAAVVDGGAASDATIARLQQASGDRGTAPLTERAAVAMLRAAGVETSTSRPQRVVTENALAAFVNVAARSLDQTVVASGKPGVTPGSLDDCFTARNHGLCVDCCKSLGLPASSCAKSCFVINKPSPSEPLP